MLTRKKKKKKRDDCEFTKLSNNSDNKNLYFPLLLSSETKLGRKIGIPTHVEKSNNVIVNID